MALRISSGLTGTDENGMKSQPPVGANYPSGSGMTPGERSLPVRSDPTAQGLMVNFNGPTNHTELLEFYFGHPSSVVKDKPTDEQGFPNRPRLSRW